MISAVLVTRTGGKWGQTPKTRSTIYRNEEGKGREVKEAEEKVKEGDEEKRTT